MILLLIFLLHLLSCGHTKEVNKPDVDVTSVEIIQNQLENKEVTDCITLKMPADSFSEASSWELCKHDDDVFIYQRWVEAEPGRKARELYAEIQVESTPEQLARIIRKEKYGTQWLSMADEYRVLSEESDSEWYAYSRFNLMPALRFDLVTKNEMKQNSGNHSITISISGQPDYLPEVKKYRRISHFDGRWEFTVNNDHQTRIRYYMFSKTKPFLPRWMTDPFVFNEMENCVLNVKKIAGQL